MTSPAIRPRSKSIRRSPAIGWSSPGGSGRGPWPSDRHRVRQRARIPRRGARPNGPIVAGSRSKFIQRGKAVQNAFAESFNGRLRDECLNENWLVSLLRARRTIEAWRIDYNVARPHSGLAGRTPEEFAKAQLITATSTIAKRTDIASGTGMGGQVGGSSGTPGANPPSGKWISNFGETQVVVCKWVAQA
jgi:integrase-like protein